MTGNSVKFEFGTAEAVAKKVTESAVGDLGVLHRVESDFVCLSVQPNSAEHCFRHHQLVSAIDTHATERKM